MNYIFVNNILFLKIFIQKILNKALEEIIAQILNDILISHQVHKIYFLFKIYINNQHQ